ncbi:hypothetical protein C8F01DRAFT_1265283 [Mycena amicta]|nr:hypothetical protein C8F01DRAFT_1265283 [Mycena amicta]
MYGKGLVWEHRKLAIAPRLMRFFLRFLARTSVIPTATNPSRRAGGVGPSRALF